MAGAKTWAMAARAVAVDSSSGTLGYCSCAASTVGVGSHEPHGGTIRRWLVGDGLVLHV